MLRFISGSVRTCVPAAGHWNNDTCPISPPLFGGAIVLKNEPAGQPVTPIAGLSLTQCVQLLPSAADPRWLLLSVSAQHPYLHPREWQPLIPPLLIQARNWKLAGCWTPRGRFNFKQEGWWFPLWMCFCVIFLVQGGTPGFWSEGQSGPRCRSSYNNGSNWRCVTFCRGAHLSSQRLHPVFTETRCRLEI